MSPKRLADPAHPLFADGDADAATADGNEAISKYHAPYHLRPEEIHEPQQTHTSTDAVLEQPKDPEPTPTDPRQDLSPSPTRDEAGPNRHRPPPPRRNVAE